MKPPTVFLGEMTNPEVEAFLRERGDQAIVIVPVGSTEQHGPHGAAADRRAHPDRGRAARRVRVVKAVVAPAVNYGLSYPHAGFTGVVHIAHLDVQALIEDLCRIAGVDRLPAHRVPERPLRQHVRDRLCLRGRAANDCPSVRRAFPVNYWDAMTPEEAAEFFGPSNGLHANKGETSAVMAINPALVDMDAANVEMPPFPEVTNPPPVHTAFFFSSPGSVYRATSSGTWGDAREPSAEFGERYCRS